MRSGDVVLVYADILISFDCIDRSFVSVLVICVSYVRKGDLSYVPMGRLLS